MGEKFNRVQDVNGLAGRSDQNEVGRMHDRGVRTLAGREGLRNTLAGRDRPHLDEAVTEAVRERWIVTEGDQIRPGSERPV